MSGFQNAAVTKGMMMTLGIASLTVSLLDIKPYFHLQLIPHMTKYHQFWRILVHPAVFANSTELLMGELLLYNIGVSIERSFGPRKYASFILISSIVSTVLSLTAVLLFAPFGLNSIPAGPCGIIFSLLWQHYRTTPSLYYFKVFNLELSSKAFQWILALQLFLSNTPSSILASLAGLGAGYLYRTDTLLLPSLSRHRRLFRPLKSYRIPLSIYNLLSRLFNPLIGVSVPPRRANRVLPGQISDSARQTMQTRTTLSNILSGRMNREGITRRTPTVPIPATATITGTTRETPDGSGGGGAGAGGGIGGGTARARAAMGEWVSEMAGSTGTRVATEEEIATLSAMFPNLSRDTIVRSLQRNDHNTARAVEALLTEI